MIENVLQKFGGVDGHRVFDPPFISFTSDLKDYTRSYSSKRDFQAQKSIEVNTWVSLQPSATIYSTFGTTPETQIVDALVDSISSQLMSAAVTNSVPILYSYTGHECAIGSDRLLPFLNHYSLLFEGSITILGWEMWNDVRYHMMHDQYNQGIMQCSTQSNEHLNRIGSLNGSSVYESRHVKEHGFVLGNGWFTYSIPEPLRFVQKYHPDQCADHVGLVGRILLSFDPKKIRRITTI
jgi:hypothetical protein